MFVDTGAWIALSVPRDGRHEVARRFFLALPTSSHLETSNYVLAESYTWLGRYQMRQAAQTLREMVISAERTRLLTTFWIGPELEEHGWRVFRQFDDQDFSFYDCTSIAICQQNRIESVFGFDSDFRIAGLDLRPGP